MTSAATSVSVCASIRPRLITVEMRPVEHAGVTGAHNASIRPRLITVEMRAGTWPTSAPSACFNSATAHHRGNAQTWDNRSLACQGLQFGHGSSPWKCADVGYHEVKYALQLQFGHGSSPWKCYHQLIRTLHQLISFNSATAHHRGNAHHHLNIPIQYHASIRPRLITVEMQGLVPSCETAARRLQFGHGSSPWKCTDAPAAVLADEPASIRPRLITVEMRPHPGRVRRRARRLQFGHGSSPWKCPATWVAASAV